MVHLSYVPPPVCAPQSTPTFHATTIVTGLCNCGAAGYRRGGPTLGTRAWRIPRRPRRRRDDEHGAEMVEFAIVVVLLIALLYGIITYGLILAAQATVTQAAADAARSGIVASSTAVATAEAEACGDIGWMNKTCGTPTTYNTTNCTFSPNPADAITAFACQMACPSNANATCLKVTVSYNYSSTPLFPEMPGLGVITPSTISSSNVLQLSTPTS